jgi:ATP-dependent exoDNAse (exonuclease V) beta subunit
VHADIESERRLAYVAITRAEDRCTVLDIPTTFKDTVVHSQFISEACLRPEELVVEKGKTASLEEKWGPPLHDADEVLEHLASLEKDWGEVL